MFTRFSARLLSQQHRTYASPSQRQWTVENKGTAFTKVERETLKIRGLLPPAVETLERQAMRALTQLKRIEGDLEKYNYLNRIKNSSETLFYYLLINNLELICPIIYTPTVGRACQEYCQIFRTAEGMYFCREDQGHMRSMLDNWPNEVSIIVVTDGSRILGLGDLGANGMGIPIGKLALYVACGGFNPQATLPIMMDMGTNTQKYLDDPLYLGSRHPRLSDKEYYGLWHEFLMAVKDKWPNAIVQFEDISNDHCFSLLEKYQSRMKCFNDDIQGTGAVVAAGFLAACRVVDIPLTAHRILFFGAGSAAVGVADQICTLIATSSGVPVEKIREQFYLIDSQGLVTKKRTKTLAKHKLHYAQNWEGPEVTTLEEAVEAVKPTALIGLSGIGGAFTRPIIEGMKQHNERPVIFALSNPTANAECTAEEVYTLTDGKGIYASGSPFAPVTLNGKTFFPGQGNNMYIFPGLGFGASLARSHISPTMVTTAAATLQSLVTQEDLDKGRVYPPLSHIRRISETIAVAVIKKAYEEGLAQAEHPEGDLHEFVRSKMYTPHYPVYSLI